MTNRMAPTNLYFDRAGQPITDEREFAQLFGDPNYKRVAYSELGETHISTVWLGMNHNWGDGPPLIFETMIFGGEYDQDQWRYYTEEEASAGHERIRLALLAGSDPWIGGR